MIEQELIAQYGLAAVVTIAVFRYLRSATKSLDDTKKTVAAMHKGGLETLSSMISTLSVIATSIVARVETAEMSLKAELAEVKVGQQDIQADAKARAEHLGQSIDQLRVTFEQSREEYDRELSRLQRRLKAVEAGSASNGG